MYPPRRVCRSQFCIERLTLWRRRQLRSLAEGWTSTLQTHRLGQYIISALLSKVWKTDRPLTERRDPRKAPLSSFSSRWLYPILCNISGRLPHPAEIGAQVPQVKHSGVFARCRDVGTHMLWHMPSRTNSEGNMNRYGFCTVLPRADFRAD